MSDLVAAAKFGISQSIEDPVREQQELGEVRQRSVAAGLDPEATAQFLRDQITASKIVQEGNFSLWATRSDQAPRVRPELGKIRAELDDLTTELLHELRMTRYLRRLPVSCSIQLAIATQSAGFDDLLHLRAFNAATQNICAVT
ncbi:gamma subclass chorismate mutase AroQ [Actinoplanes sp. TBRC 11911]|nr:gamma subclass chorismate mutase AroQ [Actinoplanes sp. TBRC 11911]